MRFKNLISFTKNPLENYLPVYGDLINNSQQIHKVNDVVEDYEGLSCRYEQQGLRDHFSFLGHWSDKISLQKKIQPACSLINPCSGWAQRCFDAIIRSKQSNCFLTIKKTYIWSAVMTISKPDLRKTIVCRRYIKPLYVSTHLTDFLLLLSQN